MTTPQDHEPPLRPLGHSSLRVAPIVIGTMARRGDHPQTRLAIYRAALAAGHTTFDTAPLYGFGAADRLLGEALRDVPRAQVQILSKVGLRWNDLARGEVLFSFEDADGQRRAVRRDSRPEAVVADVEQSLQRLGLDYLDLVQIHHPDPHTPIQETMAALRELEEQGRIRAIGVSNFSADQLRAAARALGSGRLTNIQESFSLIERRAEQALLPYCREHGIGALAYSPLGGGLLARTARTGHGELERLHAELLVPLAERYAVSPAAIAAAWAIAHPGITGAIVGVSSREQLEALLPASRVHLSDADRQQLSSAYRALGPVSFPADGTSLRGVVRRARRTAGRWLRRAGIDPAALRRTVTRDRWG